MKKYILFKLILASLVLFFTACEKHDTKEVSNDYSLELKKGEQVISQLNDNYEDPGYVAMFGNTDVTKDVVVEGTVNVKKVGLYPVKYTYKPKNGPEISRVRKVIVCDSSVKVDIEGKYVTTEETHRMRNGVETKYSGQNVVVSKIAPGFFEVSDFLGGYYEQPPRGYGAAYAASGYVQVKDDNTITFLSANPTGFGITVTGINGGIYDPSDSSIYWEADFAGMTFYVKLKH